MASGSMFMRDFHHAQGSPRIWSAADVLQELQREGVSDEKARIHARIVRERNADIDGWVECGIVGESEARGLRELAEDENDYEWRKLQRAMGQRKKERGK